MGRRARKARKAKRKPRRTVVRRRPARPRRPPARPTRVRRKPKRKPAPTPTRVVRSPREIRLEDEIVYRKRGQVVPKGTPGAKRSVYTWQVDERTGKRLRMVSKLEPDYMEKIGSVDPDGPDMGRIDAALVKSSATAAYPRAQLIEFTIKAKDARGKTRRFKTSLDLGTVRRKRKLHRAVVGRILDELRRRGFRTNYTLSLFKQARAKGLKYRISWKDWRELEVLHDMEIVVSMWK